ncbi:MAG: gamma-glutamylcyclotransferase [bacterium]|jgi:gamma-glutamylcyclotransferase (GGCT)/AIG2-like uncharacterized protein YtfP|nr:gamma-glutamylcyclotransferase [bacterium]
MAKGLQSTPYNTRLFTYGTLKKGGRLEELTKRSKFMGEYYTIHSVFQMRDYADAFPIVFFDYGQAEGKSIKGHLYECDVRAVECINQMETNANYTPHIADIINEEGDITNALMFVNCNRGAVADSQLSLRNIIEEKGYQEWQHSVDW